MRKSKREGKFKIDSKEFLVGLVGKTRKIYIEERNERKFGKLELDFDTLAWVRDVQQVLLMRIIPWVFGEEVGVRHYFLLGVGKCKW